MVSLAGQMSVVRQALELTPWNKLLYSSDGHWFPETYWLAAKQFRQVLEEVRLMIRCDIFLLFKRCCDNVVAVHVTSSPLHCWVMCSAAINAKLAASLDCRLSQTRYYDKIGDVAKHFTVLPEAMSAIMRPSIVLC